MFTAEALGLKQMRATKTIRIPRPHLLGNGGAGELFGAGMAGICVVGILNLGKPWANS